MKRIFVAGHNGMVGSALCRVLCKDSNNEIVVRSRSELDLGNQMQVCNFFASECIDEVYIAAARVGGILENSTYPAEFIYANTLIATNLIHSAYISGVKKLLFLGSSCVYPGKSRIPIKEEYLLTGPLEKTNEAYAIAKIAGLKMCEFYNQQYSVDYRSVMPTNLYGPGDNFNQLKSHVLPALIRKFCIAKKSDEPSVVVWGTGKPLREFMHVDDFADASVFVMSQESAVYDGFRSEGIHFLNVGTGQDCSISQLCDVIADAVGFTGEIVFDDTKPDGTYRKLLDSSRLNDLGWYNIRPFKAGVAQTVEYFKEKHLDSHS